MRHLEARDIPEEVKTVRVDQFDEEGRFIRELSVKASYFWREPDGSRFVSQASAQEKGMFEIDELDPPPTIQVNKYSIDGVFLGGPWRIRDMA